MNARMFKIPGKLNCRSFQESSSSEGIMYIYLNNVPKAELICIFFLFKFVHNFIVNVKMLPQLPNRHS